MVHKYEKVDKVMGCDANGKTASCPIGDAKKDAAHKGIHHRVYNTRCEMNERKGRGTYDDDWKSLREPALDHCE